MSLCRSSLKFLVLFLILSISTGDIEAQKRKKKKPPQGPSITWVNEVPASGLPEGVSHQTFQFSPLQIAVGYCIYLPPEYAQEPDRHFPVIYNLHGNGGNEFHSFEDVAVLHEGIVDGKWPPLIMVFPNGGRSTFYKDSYDGKYPIETMFIKHFIPHIDKTYRTIPKREGRCIEGFSMGGRGSIRLAMKYPDLFCSLFCQAGNVPRTADNFDPEKPDEYPNNFLGPDKQNYIDNDAFLLLDKNIKQIKGKLRIQIACGTKDGGHLPTVRDFHQHLVDRGVDHTYIELENLGHNRKEMIERMKPIWFDYHVESLRLASESASQ